MINELAFQKLQRSLLVNHFDANETLFLERELTQLRQKLFEVVYPATLGRTFAPKAGDIAASAETYSYKVYSPTGKAKIISYQGQDIPRVDVVAHEVLGKVRPVGASYGWDINELRESARLGLTLPEVKARAARDFIERGIDQIIAFGSIVDDAGNLPDVGLNGLINNSDVVNNPAVGNVPAGVLNGLFWFAGSPPTPAQILADLTTLVASISNSTFDVWKTNTLLLPVAHYNYAKETPFSALTGESILSVFMKNNPEITQVAPWYRLDPVGSNSILTKPRAIAYQKDNMVLESVIPQEFEVMPPEMKGLEFLNICHARCGGVKIYQPLAMRYMDFATS